MSRKLVIAFCCLAFCVAFVPSASAATVFLTVCPAPSTSANYNQDFGNDDLVLQCSLIQGTVTIKAHSILVDGPNGGQISSSGTAGIDLNTKVTTSSNKRCVIPADGTASITIHGALIEDQNNNGGITFRSCGNQVVDDLSTIKSAGAKIEQDCYFGLNGEVPPCTISVDKSSYFGNRIVMVSEGDLTLSDSSFQTIGPRDLHSFTSLLGSVLAGAGCDLSEIICGPRSSVCQLCQECKGKNSFAGGVESNFFAYAMHYVDFSGACINIAENIQMAALDTNPLGVCNNALAPPPTGVLNVSGAEIRNDFGKTGNIMFSAHPAWKSCSTPAPNGRPLQPDEIPFNSLAGDASINEDNSIIVDTGDCAGGGICQSKVANMNGGQDTVAGACGVVTINCTSRPIDPADNPVHADPAARGAHFVVGVPRCDS